MDLSVLRTCVFVGLLIGEALCDYKCVCSYQVELEIFEKPDPTSAVIGYMYEFDCKPLYIVDGLDPKYNAIGNEGKLGYVQMTPNIQVQTCQGSIPDIDRVPTTLPPSTTTTTTTTTTTPTTTTTTKPTTSTTPTTTSSTTAKPTTLSTTPKVTTLTTPSLPPATRPTSTPFLTAITSSIQRTTGLTTTSPTSTSTAKSSQTILVTSPPNPVATQTVSTPIVTTGKVNSTSNLSTAAYSFTCPQQISNRQYLAQHGKHCYEYVPRSDTWMNARTDCHGKRGHMLSIENQDQQNFIESFLQGIRVTQAIWLGYKDGADEERWHWDSGSQSNYTNWMLSRYRDTYHDQEDCAIMVPLRKYQWDDIFCDGIIEGKIVSHHWICQYG